jgi:hypothetical protein
MNLDDLQRKLIAAARAHTPSSTVPYAFERRIMNRLKGLGVADFWGFWATALWRAAGPCVGLALVLAAWSFLSGPPSAPGPDLSQEFENTVLAAANVDQPPPAEPLR